MLKILISTLALMITFQAHADVLVEQEEILEVLDCSSPQKLRDIYGSIQTEVKLSYVGCFYQETAQDWNYVHSKAKISLPGSGPRIEANVTQLCESLKAELKKKVVHVEDSLCMKE